MKIKPRVAILRGPLLNPYEMQSYELLQDEFEMVTFTPHQTQFDISPIRMPNETLWCPIAGKVPFEREKRKFQALKDAVTGSTFSFCGLRERLEGFDILHVKDQPFCFSYEAALAKRRYGGKLIVTQMENIPRLNEHKFMERHIKKAVLEQTDLFLAASDGARRTLLEEGAAETKIRRIANSVNVHHFSPGKPETAIRKALGIPKKAFVLLYVGRLHRDKGVFTLLEAAQALRAQEPDFHLLLVGKDEDGVDGWVRDKGLAGIVHLTGLVPYADMPRYYRQADLFALPSLPTPGWLEQFGYVLVEAMACGVPVTGSDCGAIPEVVGDPQQIFPPGSVEGLMTVVRKLKKSYSRSLRTKSRQRACRNFSSEILKRNLAMAYREVLRNDG
jgi:alpha-maltose-1-phosphate synthase